MASPCSATSPAALGPSHAQVAGERQPLQGVGSLVAPGLLQTPARVEEARQSAGDGRVSEDANLTTGNEAFKHVNEAAALRYGDDHISQEDIAQQDRDILEARAAAKKAGMDLLLCKTRRRTLVGMKQLFSAWKALHLPPDRA